MSLITISGYPCSGKTTRVLQLRQYLEENNLRVVIVSDDGPKSVYDDSQSEKPARAALFTTLQRQLGKDVVVIVDAPNYIKGFRYQMYCAARELKLRVCTIYVVATPDLCRQWNSERQDGYSQETLENLFLRYEEPSSMVRWDSPLFTVPWNESMPLPEILNAISTGVIKPPNSGTLNGVKPPTDALPTVESVTLSIVSAIMESQSGAPLAVRINLPARTLTLPELQRLKRQFVTVHKKAITLGTTERGAVDWSEQSVADKFVAYLEENLNQ